MAANIGLNEANAIIAAHQDMGDYLGATLGIASNRLRARLIAQGITDALTLSTKPDSYMKDICTIIRKQGGNSAYGLTYQVEDQK